MSILVATNLDLPVEKRRRYAIDALDQIEFDADFVHSCVAYDAWLRDSPKDCEAIDLGKPLKKWLKERDRELQQELSGLKDLLRKKWGRA